MKKIYRYELDWTANQTIEIPENAEILSVKVMDDNKPSIYATVDDATEETKKQRVIMLGTGSEISEDDYKHMVFLGTIKKKRNGMFGKLLTKYIFHVFVVKD